MTTATFAANAENWQTIATQFPQVQIKKFPPDVIAALNESNQQLLEAEKARSPIAAKIIESRETFLAKARSWTDIGEKLYLDSIVDW